jgi:hypothetical protein
VVLEKNGDQLDRSSENGRSITWSHEGKQILHAIKRRKANCIGLILRRNCLLKHVTEGNTKGRIELIGRRGRRSKQLLDDLKETRGH